MLNRVRGASVAEIQKATGWQPHSVRAALSGMRKKGYRITRETASKGKSRYYLREEG